MSEGRAAPSPSTDPATEAADRMAEFLRRDLGAAGRIPLHEPAFHGNEWAYVKDCLDTGWVSSVGKYVDRLEEMTAEFCGVARGVAVVNGTAGLHAALTVLGVGAGDAVICPAITFIASANAIHHAGAAPLFVDIDAATLGIDCSELADFLSGSCASEPGGLVHRQSGRRIAAIMAVHLFGHPADMTPLLELAGQYGLPVVEDAAEALGSRYNDRACGAIGQIGVFSFNGNKIISTGGGGVIVTDDTALADRLKHLTTTARIADRWHFDHDARGFNYRMANINAALGCAQFEQLPGLIRRKRQLADRYHALFNGIDGVAHLNEPANSKSNYWLNALLFNDMETRDRFLQAADERDIDARPCFRMIPDTLAYRDSLCASNLAASRDLCGRLANIPSSPSLIAEDRN